MVHIFKISKEYSFLVSFALIKKENLQSTIMVPEFEKGKQQNFNVKTIQSSNGMACQF